MLQIAIYLFTAFVAVLVTLFIFRQSKPSGKPIIALVGPPHSGKTSLFQLLTSKPTSTPKLTVTSCETNSADLNTFELVDCPGHPKLWSQTLQTLTNSNLDRIVYLMDCTIEPKKSAPHLLQVLELSQKLQKPLLIATNKHDLFAAYSLQTIKKELELELNALLQTNAAQTQTDEDGNEKESILSSYEEFTFSNLETEVEFIQGSVKKNDVSGWKEFINYV